MYKAQTGSRQSIFVQKFMFILLALLLFPSLDNSTVDQIITAAGPTQGGFGLHRGTVY